MNQFGWAQLTLIWIMITGYAWSFPTEKIREVSNKDIKSLENPTLTNTTCRYKGTNYIEGDVIEIEEPCLSCLCKKGSLICNLRVCPDLPEPPPPGCVIVHKQKRCCPQLLCDSEQKENRIEIRTENRQVSNMDNSGCIVNGSLYAEGSALASSSLCEYCYCIRGQQKCIKPHCVLPLEGCTPHYKEHSCCPTYYDCRDNLSGNSTIQTSHQDCERNGILYAQGEMVPSRDNATCENCYCMKGIIRCVPITCSMEFFEGCEPVHTPGQCCPSSYKCSKVYQKKKSELHLAIKNSIRSFIGSSDDNQLITSISDRRSYTEPENSSAETTEVEITTLTEETTTETTEAETTTEEPETNKKEITTLLADTEPTSSGPSITQNIFQMEERIDQGETTTELISQETTTQEMTTLLPDETKTTLEQRSNNFSEVTTSYPVVDGDVLNVTISSKLNLNVSSGNESRNANVSTVEDIITNSSHADDADYDVYDYSEPKLPPSLPNLVIYPFVAADAVVKDSKSPNYDPSSIKRTDVGGPDFYKDYFSPPAETEGGFVPKEPPLVLEGAVPLPGNVEEAPALFPPSITLPPKLKSEHCFSEGREYSHGELISEAGECISCVCFYGEVICQEATCPKVKYGCRRVAEKEKNSCCGKIICDTGAEEKPSDVELKSPKPTIHLTTIVPPVTIADTIDVTPDPFKDVIRTEPAPDLPSLMSDLLPFYVDHQTKKPVSVTYKNVVVDYYPDFHVTTTRENIKKPFYHSTEAIRSNVTERTKTPVYQPGDSIISIDNYHLTTSKPEDFNETVSAVNETLQITNDTNNNNVTEKTDVVRISIRPIVQETTEPSLQTLNKGTPVIEHVKVTRSTTKAPSPTKTFTRKPLISIRPKSTTTEPSFFDEFFKDLFDSKSTTKSVMATKHKYSAKIKTKTTTPTSQTTTTDRAEPLNKEPNAAGESFSLDSVFNFFLGPEESTTARGTNKSKYQNITRKPIKKITSITISPTVENSTRSDVAEQTSSTTSVYLQSREDVDEVNEQKQVYSSFKTDESGNPKIQILEQEKEDSKIESKSNSVGKEEDEPYVPKSPTKNTFRKPTKPSQDLGNILKLAGCNIYGRMYRVGKIITELSGPCLECMCTDYGVQCAPLKC